MEIQGRRSILLKGYDYTAAGGYFVTIMAYQRDCVFGEIEAGEMHINALGRIVKECWQAIPDHFPNADVDEFVVMPNHIHGIIFLHYDMATMSTGGARHASPLPARGTPSRSLGAIIGSFKSSVTRRAGRELNLANLWQRNYYEHIIRDQRDYERITGYIIETPRNWEHDEENNHPEI